MNKDFKEIDEYRMYTSKAETHKAINSFMGIFNGMKIDGVLNDDELAEVANWLSLHRHLQKKLPFSEIIPVLDNALMDDILTDEEVEDILWVFNRVINEDEYDEFYNLKTSSIQQLEGILHGLLADNELTDDEIHSLSDWINDNEILKGTYPFDEIESLLLSVLKDGLVTDDEREMLTGFFLNFVNTKISYNIDEQDMKDLQKKYSIEGICAVSPEVSFENKTFSFTGASYQATRNEIAEVITEKGGTFNKGVTRKTHYLIVGAKGNPCWAFSCYGRKVEKAVNLRKTGTGIVIVHERDFWDETF